MRFITIIIASTYLTLLMSVMPRSVATISAGVVLHARWPLECSRISFQLRSTFGV